MSRTVKKLRDSGLRSKHSSDSLRRNMTKLLRESRKLRERYMT